MGSPRDERLGAPPAEAAPAVRVNAQAPALEPPVDPLRANHQVLERHRVILDGTNWPPEVVAELAAGLAALPEPLRTPPGPPLLLRYSRGPVPFGFDGQTIHAYADPTEPRALLRLGKLTAADRERLWRRRAMVHAVVSRWDAARGWSRSSRWRRLNGWILPFERLFQFDERALNLSPNAYSRELGRSSAALDLATFAEEALVPATVLQPDAVPEVDQLRCQEFSKSRYLRELGLLTTDRGSCAAFDAWADLDTLASAEVLFVAASGRAPESLFGHLMLRLHRESDTRVLGPGLQPAVQMVALTGNDLPGPAYVLRGLTGGYPLVVMTAPMSDLNRQLLAFEQRTMRRFKLRLDRGETVRLLERIWELERRGRLDYRFLSDNCAYAAIFVVNGALEGGRAVKLPPSLSPLLPAAALDALAATRAFDGGSLLEPLSDALRSSREVARSAVVARAREAAVLPANVRAGLSSADPERRASAYASLTEVDAPREALFALLQHSVELERYAFDAAEASALKVQLHALKEPPPVASGEEEAAQRQRLFEHEAQLADVPALLDRPQRAQAMLEGLPKRPFSDSERATLREAAAADRRLRSLLRVQGEIVDRIAGGIDATAWLEADRARRAAEERAIDARSLRASGYARASAAVGVAALDRSVSPLITLRSAAFSEQLGDHRLHGLDPASGLSLLAGELTLAPYRIVRSDFTAVAYRNVRREAPELRTSALDDFGWGFTGGWSFREGRPFAQRGVAAVEGLAILDDTADLSRLTALGLGVHGALGLEDDGRADLILGPRLTFTHRRHLGGSYANCFKLSLEYAPGLFAVSGLWTDDLRASAEVDLVLRFGRYGFLATVATSLDATRTIGHTASVIPALWLRVERLAL